MSLGQPLQVGLTPVIIADEIEWVDAVARRGRARQPRGRDRAMARRLAEPRHRSLSRALLARASRPAARTSPRGAAHKRKVNGGKSWIKVGLGRVRCSRYPRERDVVVVTFDQDYRSNSLSNVMRKRQYWIRKAGAGRSSTKEPA